jgi:hypothetical protein
MVPHRAVTKLDVSLLIVTTVTEAPSQEAGEVTLVQKV